MINGGNECEKQELRSTANLKFYNLTAVASTSPTTSDTVTASANAKMTWADCEKRTGNAETALNAAIIPTKMQPIYMGVRRAFSDAPKGSGSL